MRATIWTNAWEMIKDRPIVGVGANAFAEAYASYAPADDYFITEEPVYHAHQMYISIAAESGILGLSGFIALIGLSVIWYRKASPESHNKAAPFAVPLAIVAFPLQSQPILYTIWWFPVLLLLMCAMLATLANK
jgi:O-antigen ligase